MQNFMNTKFWNWLAIFAVIGVTFGIWKIVEIIIWVVKHLHWY